MTRAARRYWVGIAAVHAGQRAVAATELRQSVAAARGRARKMATAALQSCESSNPVELSNSTAAAAEFTAQQTVVSWTPLPRPWLTALGCGGCIAVTALMYCLGSTTDVATLIRAGAMVRGLVDDGQWWRLATATFVHVGPVHLFVNILGLWVIGRLAEDTFGTLRTALLFVLCGFAGASASYFASEAGISAGASGALFGLLGAVLLEYTVRRRHFAIAVRNGTWGALLVVAIATLAFGSMVPEIDQAAHVAGLLCGAVAGQLLSPRHRFGRRAAWLAVPAIGAFVALLVWGVCSIAQTNVATLMLGQPWVQRTVAGATLVAPQRWRQIEDELVDPDIYVVVAIEVLGNEAGGPDERRIMTWIEGEPARARARNFATISAAETSQIPLPASWKASEYDVAAPDAWTGSQRFRVVSFGRVDRDRVVVGSLYVPQSLVKSAAAQLSRVIASIHLESSQR
jgi:membrane associated rhomboid family serine protease